VPASLYALELGSVDGTMLTWAFLGHTSWFQVVLGATEVVPSVLLLFRRTRVLGAVLMLPPTLGVCLVNFALRLWPETRVISAALLALNLVVLFAEWSAIRNAVRALLAGAGDRTRWRKVEDSAGALLLIATAAGSVWLLHSAYLSRTAPLADFIGDRQINGSGAWLVESVVVGDEDVPTPATRIFFDFEGHCLVARAGDAEFQRREHRREAWRKCTYTADREQRRFALHSQLDVEPSGEVVGTYHVTGDRLTVSGTREARPVRIVLRAWKWE
jgi:hypothetical protein